MADDAEAGPSGAGAGAPDVGDFAEHTKTQWEQALMAYAKSTNAMAANAPFMAGAVPFPMAFPQAYMLPAMMPYAGLTPFYPSAGMGQEGDAKSNKSQPDASERGSSADDDSEGDDDDVPANALTKAAKEAKRRLPRASSLSQKRTKSMQTGMGVKSKSQAALALLASAAGNVNPGSSTHPSTNPIFQDMWGQAAAAAAAAVAAPANTGATAAAPSIDSDLVIDPLDEVATLAGMDERELKRQRRKQSNRESARRSRLRKQAECDTLQKENKQLRAELQQLRNEKVELNAQIAILNAKLSLTGAFGSGPSSGAAHPSLPQDERGAQAALEAAAAAMAAQEQLNYKQEKS